MGCLWYHFRTGEFSGKTWWEINQLATLRWIKWDQMGTPQIVSSNFWHLKIGRTAWQPWSIFVGRSLILAWVGGRTIEKDGFDCFNVTSSNLMTVSSNLFEPFWWLLGMFFPCRIRIKRYKIIRITPSIPKGTKTNDPRWLARSAMLPAITITSSNWIWLLNITISSMNIPYLSIQSWDVPQSETVPEAIVASTPMSWLAAQGDQWIPGNQTWLAWAIDSWFSYE